MRSRLFVVFLVPLIGILLILGGAYAASVSRNVQQNFLNQQLADLSYFATGSRHALRSANPQIVESEMVRYSELYDARIAVIDRSGSVWASGDDSSQAFDDETAEKVMLALSGRRSEVTHSVWPWNIGEVVVVEPVFDDGNVIGAVMIAASADTQRSDILKLWLLLVVGSVLVILVLGLIVNRLTTWVLQPMRRVDRAMAAIEHGEMDVRISDDTGPPEMRRMIRVFNQMADEIERVVSRQQEFVLNASHELRNPLGALLMRVEYLSTGLDGSWEPEVEQTREEGRRMARILDTLLFMARSGMKDSMIAPVDLVRLVRGRTDAWQDNASDKRVRFVVQAPPALVSVTDRTAVESALDAVLDNAVKFAPDGSEIEVTVKNNEESVIVIRDHGPGLNPEDLERATERFWRNPRDQNMPGSGLGLAIATDLLTALGGRLDVATAKSGGLRVSLYLPVVQVAK